METAMSKLSEPMPIPGVSGNPVVVELWSRYKVEQGPIGLASYGRRRDAVRAWNRIVKKITHAAYLKATI